MKRFIALAVCFLLGTFSAPAPFITAAQTTVEQQTVQVVTQAPIDTDVATLVVEGPTEVKIGDLVVISVEQSRAASFKWILPTTDNRLVIDDGKRVIFSSGVSGEFQFTVGCSLGDTCDVAIHTVTVTGAPAPNDALTSKIALWCDKVESETKRDDCLKLAQSFSSVAMVMEGGTLITPQDIVTATFKSNQDALGDRLDDWFPFRDGLARELSVLSESGNLPDTQAHIAIWKRIASSLREYASTL